MFMLRQMWAFLRQLKWPPKIYEIMAFCDFSMGAVSNSNNIRNLKIPNLYTFYHT